MNRYVILTYAVALALLWGYAAVLWLQSCNHGGRS
jgi:hypothetical protein